MTDVSDEIETNSGLVEVDSIVSTRILREKILSVDENKNRYIICLGDKVFDTLLKGLSVSKKSVLSNKENKLKQFRSEVGNEVWYVFRVWHSANYGKFIHKSESELPVQLKFIHEFISAHP